MFRGFNLELGDINFPDGSHDAGLDLHSYLKSLVQKTLDPFFEAKGDLNASAMQENWFPDVDAQIFLSHSHKDERLALALAGWLHEQFGVVSFIDSAAWGYSDDLLRSIDEAYCIKEEIPSKIYSYEKRNCSTSHVHMMLNTALGMMIDKAECLIFLNTPASITPSNEIEGRSKTTKSSWIYSEIAMTRIVRKRTKSAHRPHIKNAMVEALIKSEFPDLNYKVLLGHLTNIGIDDLNQWSGKWQQQSLRSVDKALDLLYELNP